MPSAVIKINGVVGSDTDLPIATLVQLDNQNSGGETTYAWTILDQPPGPPDTLSNPLIQNPTFTPNKEGTYLIQLVVNGTLTDTVVAGVLQLKTRTRVPATGETTEASTAEGWAPPVDETLRLVDTMRASPGVVVGVNGSGGVLSVGDVLRIDDYVAIKPGLPGEERVPSFTKALTSSVSLVTDSLFILVSGVDGNVSPANGDLVNAFRFGALDDLADGIGTAAVGDVVYLSNSSVPSIATGAKRRPIGRVIRVSAPGLMSIWFDGAAPPFWQQVHSLTVENHIFMSNGTGAEQLIIRDVGTGGLTIGTAVVAPLSLAANGTAWWQVEPANGFFVAQASLEVTAIQSSPTDPGYGLVARAGQGGDGVLFAFAGGTGGTLTLRGGDGGADNGAGGGGGGFVVIDSGTKVTSGAFGQITIGVTDAGQITIGRTAGTFLVNSPSTFNESLTIATTKKIIGATELTFNAASGSFVDVQINAISEARFSASVLRVGTGEGGTPVAYKLRGANATGTNIPAANLTVAAGLGTGNAAASAVVITAPLPIASGTGQQTETTVATFKAASLAVAVPTVVGAASPAASAVLQADSTTQGLLPPRMTSTQRDAISSPAAGLVIFNTTTSEMDIYDGTNWRPIRPVRQSLIDRISVNTTTTSTTFVNLITRNITIKAGGIIIARATMSASNTNANQSSFFRLTINGVTQDAAVAVANAANAAAGASIQARVAGLGAGTFAVAIDWRVSANTGQIRPGAAPDAEGAQLITEEYTV